MIGASKVFEGFSGKLGERWLENLFTPALLFWAGGALAYAVGPDFRLRHWNQLRTAIAALDGSQQLLLGIAALLVVLVSSALAERFTLPLLRLFQGAWPRRAQPLAEAAAARWQARKADLDAEFQELKKEEQRGTLSRDDTLRLIEVDRRRLELPEDPKYFMATQLGNVLRVAERRPYDKYGLDTTVCWPRLWLAMPDSAKTEISAARARLDASTRLTFWSLLFFLWGIWSLLAVPIAALLVVYGYRAMLEDARGYGKLFESAFDVERRDLYEAVGWKFPANASLEKSVGMRLTQYLLRGDDDPNITFTTTD
ncbi:MAG: hypothetical protein IAI49_17110 [Candidatus Eremiobacteraeota bacterium]|nr:hypothetical protein [Candidatus Eremiobacteraeota bacterium]